MDDETKASLAAALAGGYILGRTKKGRLALTTMTFLLGRRFGFDPQQLVVEGLRRVREVPQVSELEEQVRAEGVEAARKALSSVVGRGLESVTGGISSRLPGAGSVLGKEDDEDDREDADQEEPREEAEEAPEESDAKPNRRRHHRDAGESERPGPSRAAGKKRSAPHAADRPAKKAAKKAAPAKKAASAPAKKAAPAKRAARSAPSRPSRPGRGGRSEGRK
ncbi:histone protein [Streptomyces sp. NBC_01497]|uniref:histone protein n=1 Tax=Streptomyces sp. NBC_01497 TaxID=2903885 RepID=UPI002E2FAE2D|nr:histone protein [Streptomyces sp. NBC_01497]